MIVIAVAAAGAAGAMARYVVDFWIVSLRLTRVPLGTFTVNVTGSLALGFVAGLVAHHGLGDLPAVPISAGFLGAYTTFSTWMYEAVRLFERREWRGAAFSLFGGLLIGVAAAAAGFGAAWALAGRP